MKRRPLGPVVIAAALLVACPAGSEVVMPCSVVGSGGGETSGDDHVLFATLGQPVVGVVSGPSNINGIGFWYQPGWVLTGTEPGTPVARFWLWQNYPNPFNPVTIIEFSVPERARVMVRLYDVAGREVGRLVDEEMDPGRYTRLLDAGSLSSGVYFCRMESGSFTETRKLVLLK